MRSKDRIIIGTWDINRFPSFSMCASGNNAVIFLRPRYVVIWEEKQRNV